MARNQSPLETPKARRVFRAPSMNQEAVGRISESFARAMGTGAFLITMTIIVMIWLSWNTLAPVNAQYDPRALNFSLLTLILSLQASYAAPLILLAQNRQDEVATKDFVKDELREAVRELLEELQNKPKKTK